MTGGYLTIDLSKAKQKNDLFTIPIEIKGIFKYIKETIKPIYVIYPEWYKDFFNSYNSKLLYKYSYSLSLNYGDVTKYTIDETIIKLPIVYTVVNDNIQDIEDIGLIITSDNKVSIGEL